MTARIAFLTFAAVGYSLTSGAEPTHSKEGLVTAEILFSNDPVTLAYRRAIERTLYSTPGELARFIQLPGHTDPETVVSLYQVKQSNRKYMVSCTQASSSLWETIPRPGAIATKSASTIRVLRCDAEVSPTMASAIHDIWLRMLTNVTPELTHPGVVYLEGTMEIFTAMNGSGRELRGARPHEYAKNGRVSALIELAFLLKAYCDPPPEGRDVVARKLMEAVKDFSSR